MIFVTLGTQKFQLNRLLIEIDELCREKKINDEIIAQIGHSTYEPQNYKFYRFLDKKDFDEMISRSSLVITHSGVGSIITALENGKPTIVFPRLKQYEEHVDNHQIEIALSFERKGHVLCCRKEESLFDCICVSKEKKFTPFKSNSEKMVEIIKEFMK